MAKMNYELAAARDRIRGSSVPPRPLPARFSVKRAQFDCVCKACGQLIPRGCLIVWDKFGTYGHTGCAHKRQADGGRS